MTRRRNWIYLALFVVLAINYTDRVALSVAAKPIAAEFHLSPVELGYVFSSFLWTYVVCLVPMGILVDRWGARKANMAGLGLWSFATLLTAFAPSLGVLMGTRLAMGVGESSSYPMSGRVVREWAPVTERGFATTLFNAGAYAGPAFGAITVGWLISISDWRTAFVVAGLFGLLVLIPWMIFYRKPEQASWLSEEERAHILVHRDAGAQTPSSPTTLLHLLRSKSMWGIALTQGCAVYSQYLFLTWLPNYLQTTRDLGILKTGFYTALPYVGAMIFSVIIGRISDRLLDESAARSGKRRLMVVATLLSSSVIVLAPVVEPTWAILLLLTVSLTGVSAGTALNITLANDLLRDIGASGKVVSLVVIGGNIFGILAPVVTGYVVAGAGGFGWAFVIAGLLLVTGALSSLTLTRGPLGEPGPLMRGAEEARGVTAAT